MTPIELNAAATDLKSPVRCRKPETEHSQAPAENPLKSLIEHIAKSLVDRPDEVVIREVAGEETFLYELQVGDGEVGKVIGKHGATIRAIRQILMGVAAKDRKRVTLEIIE